MSESAPDKLAQPIQVCDETLRDGSQSEGVAFSVESKLRLLQELDRLGVSFVVGGWPLSSPRDVEFFERAPSLRLEHVALTAFGSTCRRDRAPEHDAHLAALLETGCSHVTIFGKSWDLHATKTLGVSLEMNLKLIHSSKVPRPGRYAGAI